MTKQFEETPDSVIEKSGISRVIPCREIELSDPIKWLSLGVQDFRAAPMLSIFYGLLFALIPWTITYLVAMTGWHIAEGSLQSLSL